jgi:hypothetical protein
MARLLELNKAWSAWCNLVSDLSPDEPGSTAYFPIHERLARFNPAHAPTPEHVETILDVLYRGVPLLLAALGWDDPIAGSRGGKNPQTDRARGDQWRLVMAYGGFETLVKGLLSLPQKNELTDEDYTTLLAKCALPRYKPIPSPEQREAIRERWFTPEAANGRQSLLEFLGLSDGDTQVIYRWLAQGLPISTWHQALILAQALRDVTAHGALSASKTREWRLRPAFHKLTADLANVTGRALKALLASETPATAVSRPQQTSPAAARMSLVSRPGQR